MKKKEPPKNPPAIQSLRYNLFSQFIANDPNTVSNTIELWESIPKYFLTPQQVKKLRTKDGLANPYEWSYFLSGTPYAVKIQPALIEQSNGSYKAFFPGITEELVEEALMKILSYQGFGFHDPRNFQTRVFFSLSMLEKELKNKGKTRNRNQIKQAIKVMSSCIITLYRNGDEFWSGSILSNLYTINRAEYLSDTDSLHAAYLPTFISLGINLLEFRQFNYDRLMSCSEQLTRWLYKKLINRYKQAGAENTYHINFSTIAIESGFLQQRDATDNRKKVIKALKELINKDVICSYKTKDHRKTRKIVDVTYLLRPSSEFIKEQKAANKRINYGIEKNKEAGIPIP